jgi:diguanylate cyclase
MRTWLYAAVLSTLGVVVMAAFAAPWMHPYVGLAGSNLGQLGAAAAAAALSLRAARRTTGRHRHGWRLIAVGTGGWAAGQTVWTFYEVVLGREVPFPSAADVGFLLFPLATAYGLVVWLGIENGFAARGRDLLDGAIIGGSLLVLSWVTTLGAVIEAGTGTFVSVSLSLAYPVGDVILATLVLLALARGVGPRRTPLLLLALGLGGLALADSAYVYLVTLGTYSSTDLVTAGWLAGFVLVAVAASAVTAEPASAGHHGRRRQGSGGPVAPRVRMLLPYVPLLSAGVVVCVRLLTAPVTPTVDLAMGIALVTLVLGRQFLAMAENHRLLTELQVTRDALQHQALHDPLTGLANRTLFADRLEHALSHPGADVSVLFCDLDDFKHVNDELGHDVGDELLRAVAGRLTTAVRPSDTVARLGGDEFAILLEQAGEAEEVAGRVVTAVHAPYDLGGRQITTTVSVGVAHNGEVRGAHATHLRVVGEGERNRRAAGEEIRELARDLLRSADVAMYTAKATGKGRAVVAGGAASVAQPRHADKISDA